MTMLDQIPEGTPVCNVEARPGDGGKFARSGGNSAFVDTRMGDKVRIRLPSGSLKDLPAKCRATIGVLAGHGRTEKPIMKAGAAHKRAKARGEALPNCQRSSHEPSGPPPWREPSSSSRTQLRTEDEPPPGQKVGHIAPRRTGRGRVRKD